MKRDGAEKNRDDRGERRGITRDRRSGDRGLSRRDWSAASTVMLPLEDRRYD